MAKAKRKLLPKDFDDLLKTGSIDALKAVFDICDVNARGGVFKQTALAFNDCPDELAYWLVQQGADLSAADTYGETPLHSRSGHWQGRIGVLLELSANVNHEANGRGTPLHRAAAVGNSNTVKQLLERGANPNAINASGLTPLAHALQQCSNSKIAAVSEIAEILLVATATEPERGRSIFSRIFGPRQSSVSQHPIDLKPLVIQIGENFEFHRSNFNADYLDETSAGLDRLYRLFDVAPVPRRIMHDGKASIVVQSVTWEDKHQELWEQLVPSSGAAETVQGEVIRISGRIHDELYRNGGANWDKDYKEMARAFLAHVTLCTSLPGSQVSEARKIAENIPNGDGDTSRLCAMAVDWVALNPNPMPLPKPTYRR
jgi:hypothetical protein